MPPGFRPHLHVRQGDLCTGKRLQDARACGPLRRAGRASPHRGQQGRPASAPALAAPGFPAGSTAAVPGSRAVSAPDLVLLPDKQRTEAQGEVFDQMEVPFQRPSPSESGATASGSDSWSTGALVTWTRQPQPMPPGGKGRLVPLHAGHGRASLHLGAGGAMPSTPSAAHVAAHGRLVPLPPRRQQPGHVVRSSTRPSAACKASSSRMWRLPRPGAGRQAPQLRLGGHQVLLQRWPVGAAPGLASAPPAPVRSSTRAGHATTAVQRDARTHSPRPASAPRPTAAWPPAGHPRSP